MKVSLFKLALFISLVAAGPAIARSTLPQNEFSLKVTVITSEHSRDSHSTATQLSVAGDTLTYTETYSWQSDPRWFPWGLVCAEHLSNACRDAVTHKT
jgi:hypothetical protein